VRRGVREKAGIPREVQAIIFAKSSPSPLQRGTAEAKPLKVGP